MDEKRKKEKRYLIHCLRCGRRSYVGHTAQCRHCGSFAVRMVSKGKGR